MKSKFLNPHPIDMKDYYAGQVIVVGGDLKVSKISKKTILNSISLDWTFLKKKSTRTLNLPFKLPFSDLEDFKIF